MNRTIFPLIFLLCSIAFYPAALSAQFSAREEFNLLLDEAFILQQNQPLPADQFALIDSARQYADSQMYDLAVIFLEQFLQNQSVTGEEETATIALPTQNRYELFIRTGIDYNRQEFEVGYFQADSVFIDQVQKPYLAISYRQPLIGDNTSFFLDFRYDKENMTALGKLESAVNTATFEGRFNIGYVYDNNSLYPELGYNEANTRQYLRWQIANGFIWRLDNNLRYKKYSVPSVSVPDFVRDMLTTGFSLAGNNGFGYTVNYNLDFNESLRVANNDYRMHTFNFVVSGSYPAVLNYSVDAAYRFNRFQYIVSDSVIKNKSQSLFADVNCYLNIMPDFRLKAVYRPKIKSYQLKTEQEPDYTYHELSSYLSFDLSAFFSMEAGYLYESKRHEEFSGSQSEYIREQNYYGNGIAFGMDYNTLGGTYISLSGSYVWRRYPDAVDLDIFRMYSNKNILSLLLMLQIPLTDHLELNGFMSYDNDQDLDTDENNTRSSFFSAELIYRF